MTEITVISHTDMYDNWHWGGPTNGKRSRLAAEWFEKRFPDKAFLRFSEPVVDYLAQDMLEATHSLNHIARVSNYGEGGAWPSTFPHARKMLLATLARRMFAGTINLAEQLQTQDDVRFGINFMGAKHHAMYDHTSGFCVFNDMAAAAKYFTARGERVLYIDWDAHAGDGVEELLLDEPDVITLSIHEDENFPYLEHGPDHCTELFVSPARFGPHITVPSANSEHLICRRGINAYRINLPSDSSIDTQSDTPRLLRAMVETIAAELKPTRILVAGGADGHLRDPLSSLQYDYWTYEQFGKLVGDIAVAYDAKVLFGGAGGYLPDYETPYIYTVTTIHIQHKLNRSASVLSRS